MVDRLRRNLLLSGLAFSASAVAGRLSWGRGMGVGVPERKSFVPPGYELAWSDEFNDGSFDRSKWVFRTDTKQWSTQLPESVSVSGGNLVIALNRAPAGEKVKYTGGGVISREAFSYGYYECRMRIRAGKGWHSSFWLMKRDGSGGTNTSAADLELDVIENDSIDLRSYSITTHKWKGGHVAYGHKRVNTPPLSEFHVYGCEYTPATVRYYFDGALEQSTDIASLPQGDLNIWLTSIASWLGNTDRVDETQLPGHVEYDYARFYRKA